MQKKKKKKRKKAGSAQIDFAFSFESFPCRLASLYSSSFRVIVARDALATRGF